MSRLQPSQHEKETLEKLSDPTTELKPRRKRKRPGGPNPLSVLKSKRKKDHKHTAGDDSKVIQLLIFLVAIHRFHSHDQDFGGIPIQGLCDRNFFESLKHFKTASLFVFCLLFLIFHHLDWIESKKEREIGEQVPGATLALALIFKQLKYTGKLSVQARQNYAD